MLVTNETKTDRFHRLAPKRVTRVLRDLKILGNCAGAGYEYSQDDIGYMIATINDAVLELEQKFTPKSARQQTTFAFRPPQSEGKPRGDGT